MSSQEVGRDKSEVGTKAGGFIASQLGSFRLKVASEQNLHIYCY